MPATYITSRGYRLPDTADAMADSVWYNLWSRKNWPFQELMDGATLYWYDANQKAIVWKSRVTKVQQFKYASKHEVINRIDEDYHRNEIDNPYLVGKPNSGYCVSYKVEAVEPVKIPKPAQDFRRLGWMRAEEDPDGNWFGLLDAEPADKKGPFAVPMVFMRIAWMTHYEGITGSDKPKGGGDYVAKQGYGHEIYNFQNFNGSYYGFVQASGGGSHGTIVLERVRKQAKGDSLSGVLVVWVATHPSGGAVIVGWYRNATIFRSVQQPPSRSKRDHDGQSFGYNATCQVSDGTRLDLIERTFSIPQDGTGAFGQSNVWFADSVAHNGEFRTQVLKYIETGERPTPPSPTVAKPSTGSPRQTDPLLRAKVEQATVEMVWEHFEKKLKYTIGNKQQDNVGWDLTATLGKIELLLEVKGVSGAQTVVELTPNEYTAMEKFRDRYVVCIVSNALVDPTMELFSYNQESGQWVTRHNRVLNLVPLTGVRCTAVDGPA